MLGLRPVLRPARRFWFAGSAWKPCTGPATPLPPVASVARLMDWSHRLSVNCPELSHRKPSFGSIGTIDLQWGDRDFNVEAWHRSGDSAPSGRIRRSANGVGHPLLG